MWGLGTWCVGSSGARGWRGLVPWWGSRSVPRVSVCLLGGVRILGRAGKRDPGWEWGALDEKGPGVGSWVGQAGSGTRGTVRASPKARKAAARPGLGGWRDRRQGSAPPGKRAAGEGLRSRPPAWGGSGSVVLGQEGGRGQPPNALCGPRGPGWAAWRGPGGLGGRGGKCGGGALQQGGRGEGQPSPRDPFIV